MEKTQTERDSLQTIFPTSTLSTTLSRIMKIKRGWNTVYSLTHPLLTLGRFLASNTHTLNLRIRQSIHGNTITHIRVTNTALQLNPTADTFKGQKEKYKAEGKWETVSVPTVTNKNTAILLTEDQSSRTSSPQMLLQVKLAAQ